MTELLQTSLAHSSVQAYERHWYNFQHFVAIVLGKPFQLPARPDILGKYMSHLCVSGYSYATVVSMLSVVSFAHKLRDLPDPTAYFIIQKLLVGIKNAVGRNDMRSPITVVIMKKFLYYIDLLWGETWKAKLLRAIYTMMFALGLRIGEVAKSANTEHTVQMASISWILKGRRIVGFKLHLASYKFSGGETQTLTIRTVPGDELCPVTALLEYLAWRGGEQGFLFLTPSGKVVTRKWVADHLKQLISVTGLDHTKYNTHSMRIGACTRWAQLGATVTEIKLRGRWKSFAFTKYLRPKEVVF